MRFYLLQAASLLLLPAAGCGTTAEDGNGADADGVGTAAMNSAMPSGTADATGTSAMSSSASPAMGNGGTPTGDGASVGATPAPDGSNPGSNPADSADDSAAAGGLVPATNGCPGQLADETGSIQLSASAANNYSFASTLTFVPTPVAPNVNLTFDWSALTHDFLGHPLDVTTDVNMVSVMLWRLNQADLEVKLNNDELAQADMVNLAMFYPDDLLLAHPEEGGTRAELLRPSTDADGNPINVSDLTLFRNPLAEDEFMPFFDDATHPPEGHTFTLIASTGTVAGEGTRMIQAFKLDPSSTTTEIVMNDQSTELTYTADLQSLTPTQVPVGVAGLTIDWSDIELNAMGHTFSPTKIAEVQVARFEESPAELEGKFLDLELIATDMYRAEVPAGTSFEMSALVNDAGQAFAGIDGTGTWIVALICGACRNPAPWYISTLTPCGG